MNKEIREILKYLESREDYLIWAGFARFAHLGLKTSPDVDVYVDSQKTMNEISADFQKGGWKLEQPTSPITEWKQNRLKKNETTFDLIFSRPASNLFFQDKVKIKVYGYKVNFISKEVLFLTELGELSSLKRTDEKRKRDLEAVIKLRDKINLERIREIVAKLPNSYWLTGLI